MVNEHERDLSAVFVNAKSKAVKWNTVEPPLSGRLPGRQGPTINSPVYVLDFNSLKSPFLGVSEPFRQDIGHQFQSQRMKPCKLADCFCPNQWYLGTEILDSKFIGFLDTAKPVTRFRLVKYFY